MKFITEDISFEEINKTNVEMLYEIECASATKISKKEYLNKIDFTVYEHSILVKCTKNSNCYGVFEIIDKNIIDGHVYIKFIHNGFAKEKCNIVLKTYIDYLFNLYPIRKIYYELFLYEIDIAEQLKNVGFKIEVKYKDFKCDSNKYYTKYVLALSRKDFYQDE